MLIPTKDVHIVDSLFLQDDVCIETEEGVKHCKLIAVHAGLEEKKSVDEQLEILRAKDTSIPRIEPLSGRRNVWDIPQVSKNIKDYIQSFC